MILNSHQKPRNNISVNKKEDFGCRPIRSEGDTKLSQQYRQQRLDDYRQTRDT